MFVANKGTFRDPRYRFCKVCKRFHSYKVLVQQVIYKESVVDRVIRVAQDFRSPYVLADALEISPPTLYRWLRHYFRMSFGHFRDMYILGRWDSWVQPIHIREHSYEFPRVTPFKYGSLGPQFAGRQDRGNALPPLGKIAP